MNRREFTASVAAAALAGPLARTGAADAELRARRRLPRRPLPVPPGGRILTAVAIGPGVNVIDMSGPWEVFQDAVVARAAGSFELFTVAEDSAVVEATGGLRVEPTHTYATAPQPHVVVVPAHQATAATHAWLRRVARRSDVVMSVCTGAFVVAEAGLLDGKTATTHHQSYDELASSFPKVKVVRGRRFVEHEHVATAGGLTSGIDLALRVVERYLGAAAARTTADYMEHARRSA